MIGGISRSPLIIVKDADEKTDIDIHNELGIVSIIDRSVWMAILISRVRGGYEHTGGMSYLPE